MASGPSGSLPPALLPSCYRRKCRDTAPQRWQRTKRRVSAPAGWTVRTRSVGPGPSLCAGCRLALSLERNLPAFQHPLKLLLEAGGFCGGSVQPGPSACRPRLPDTWAPRVAVAQRPSPTRPPHLAMAGKEGRRGAAPRPPAFAVGEVTGRGFPSCSSAGRPGQLCRGDGCRCRPGARLPAVPSTRSSLGEFPAAGASLFTSVRLARRTESCRSRCTFR